MVGDFGQIARYMEREAEAFVERLRIIPGMKVLDVACGTGKVAVPAARKGAQVVGIDIAPNLLEQARQRAVCRESRDDLRGGDAEQLPYPDGHFDVVASMFGAMFAPRPEHWHGCVYPYFHYLCKRGHCVHEQIGPLRHLEHRQWMMATPIKILHSSRVLPFSDIDMRTGNKDAS